MRIEVSIEELSDLGSIENMFSQREDIYNNLPETKAVIVNYFQTPEVE